jgi:hypothetical protein
MGHDSDAAISSSRSSPPRCLGLSAGSKQSLGLFRIRKTVSRPRVVDACSGLSAGMLSYDVRHRKGYPNRRGAELTDRPQTEPNEPLPIRRKETKPTKAFRALEMWLVLVFFFFFFFFFLARAVTREVGQRQDDRREGDQGPRHRRAPPCGSRLIYKKFCQHLALGQRVFRKYSVTYRCASFDARRSATDRKRPFCQATQE